METEPILQFKNSEEQNEESNFDKKKQRVLEIDDEKQSDQPFFSVDNKC